VRAIGSPAEPFCSACLLGLGLPDVQALRSFHPGSLAEYLQIINVVAEGPRARVYLGQWRLPDDGFAALKRLHVATASDPDREAQVLRLVELDHPHVATLFDVGRDAEGRPYTITEYVPGTPLPDYCRRTDVQPGECLELFRQAADTLTYLHGLGVFHLNLKPSNVLVLDPPIGVQLLDFEASLPHGAPSRAGVATVDAEPDIHGLGSLLASWLDHDPVESEVHTELRRISQTARGASGRSAYRSIHEMAGDLTCCAARLGASDPDGRS
jgi:serine/threonine protein kinase